MRRGWLWKLALGAVVSVGAAVAALAWLSTGCRFPTEHAAQTQARVLRTAVQHARVEIGVARCFSVQQLIAGRFLDPAAEAEDPWGTPLEIVCSDEDVVVSSAGPDRRWRTRDDVRVPRGL